MVSSFVRYIDRRFYPSFADNWDTELFRDLVHQYISPTVSALDFGAGRGALPSLNFRKPGRFIAGVDIDSAVFDNPYLDEAKLLDADGRIPYGADRFDVVFAHNVLEHLSRPAVAFDEICRVLRPGGIFISKTPNRNHYVPMLARLTPHWFHVRVNRHRGRQERDTFPTVYRCNTCKELTRFAEQTGFCIECVEHVEGRPEYLRMNAPLYLVGLAYERVVNGMDSLSAFRAVLLTTLRKSPRLNT